MGSVEVALEVRGREGERVVALKRLLPEGARDSRHKEMFLREARLAALLAHPNVVHAFAFGELAGELFIAMEYIEGEPLSHVLRAAQTSGRRLAPALVAFLLAQVCDGLHAAHELRDDGVQGLPLHVVHRDVSPHNVMIAYDGHVKLLDFGVAKFDAAGSASETRTGEVKGKMAYMSPEQALGERLDRRSDLFSVGALLFECLTGERMWGSGTDLEVMRRLALERPPRLDAVLLNAPPALVELHASLVAREPDKRPASARQVAEELRMFAAASAASPDSEPVRKLMQSLFARQAEARRALLTASLERVAPSTVESLRRSLKAPPESWTSSERGRLVPPRPPTRSGWTGRSHAAFVIGLLLMTLVGAMMMASAAMRNSRFSGGAAAERTAASPVRSTQVFERPAPPPIPAEESLPPMATAAGTTIPTAARPVAPAAIPGPLPRNAARTSAAGQPAAVATKLPHVDPTPF
jgi:serine/threonine-protein kinase